MQRSLTVLLVIVAALLLACLAFAHHAERPAVPAPSPAAPSSTPGWLPYESATYRFSAQYPAGYSVNPDYEYQALGPEGRIPGVSFTVPASLAAGTNLSRDTYMSVEFPGSSSCDAVQFVGEARTSSTRVTEDGVDYSVATGGGAAAGNLYQETAYAAIRGNTCFVTRLLVHTTNIGNYDPGTVRAFDVATLEPTFAAFRRSVRPLR